MLRPVPLIDDLKHNSSNPARKQGATLLLVIVAVALGIFYILSPTSTIIVIALALVLIITASIGETRLLLYCYGLSITFGEARIHGIPESTVILAAISVGALYGALLSNKLVGGDWLLLLVTCFVGAYALLEPASTNAGKIAFYAVILIPASLFVLRWALANMPNQRSAPIWFTAGCAVAIGIGLVQAYQAVGSNYASYISDRVFVSAIGSSNYAAAVSMIPGLLLLTLGLQASIRRIVLIGFATPFLAAPFVLASRGAVLALACGVLAIAFNADRNRRRVRIVRIVTVIFVILATALIAANQDWYVWRRFATKDVGAAYLSGRVELWKTTINYIQVHPLLGLGPGRVTDQLLYSHGIAYSHQFYLEALAQLGVLGGIVFLWAIRPRPWIWTPIVPALVAIMIDSAIEPVMSTPPGAALFAGLATCHWLYARRRTREPVFSSRSRTLSISTK